MFQDDDDSKYISTPKSPGGIDPHLNLLIDFAKKNGLTPGSTTSGTHNRGSRHYSGNALDIKGSGAFSDAYVSQLSKLAADSGLILRDERTRPKGQLVWGGPHVHLEHAPSQLDDDKYIVGAQTPSTQTLDDDSKYVTGASTGPWGGIYNKLGSQSTGTFGEGVPQTKFGQQVLDEAAMDKIARNIEWHFGYGVLASLSKLPEDKQRKIIEMANGYAAADEKKKSTGALITKSPAWQLHNQQLVGAVEGKDIEARQPADVQAKMARDFSAGANPLLHIPLTPRLRANIVRPVVEALAKGGAGIVNAVAGVGEIAAKGGSPGARYATDVLERKAAETGQMIENAQEVSPQGRAITTARDVGAGVVEFAPLMALPELGVESVLARIGLAGLKGGVYTGFQAAGRGEGAKGIAKSAGLGAAQFALLGVPLPGKTALTKFASNLIITGGGTIIINRATGQPVDESIVQGLIMSAMRFPEVLESVKVKTEKGVERPATITDIRRMLPAAKFDIETAQPKPEATTPPGRSTYYRTRQAIVEPQGELTEIPPQAEPQLEEAKLSQQYPGVLRASESTAASTLKSLRELKGGDEWNTLNAGQKASVDAQIKALDGQGVSQLPTSTSDAQRQSLAEKRLQQQLDRYFEREKVEVSKSTEAVRSRVILPEPPTTKVEQTTSFITPQIRADLADRGFSESEIYRMPPSKAHAILGEASQPASEPIESRVSERRPTKSEPPLDAATERERQSIDATALSTRPATAEQVRAAQSPNGTETHLTVRRFLASDYRDKILAQIGSDAEAMNPTELGGIRASSVSFRKPDGSVVTVKDAQFANSRPTYGDKRNGFVVERTAGDGETAAQKTQAETEAEVIARFRGQKDSAGAWNFGDIVKAMDDLRERFPELDEAALRAKFMAEYGDKTKGATTIHTAGQEGSAGLNAISGGALGKLEKLRQTVVTLAQQRGVKDTMKFTRDKVDNQAAVFGNQMKNDVEGLLRRSLGDKSGVHYQLGRVKSLGFEDRAVVGQTAYDALSFVVESQGNPIELNVMRQKIADSLDAKSGWQKRALKAIDYAEANYAKLQPAAQRYSEITNAQIDNEVAAGIDTLKRAGYVMHAQDIEGAPVGLLAKVGDGEATGFRKVRVHETFADSIAAGINPKTLDSLDLLSTRVRNGQRLINKRQWVTDLRNTVDPKSQAPVVVDPQYVQKADGTTYPQPPAGYSVEYNGFEPIAVKAGYEGIYSALTDPSWFSKNAGARLFLKGNAIGKSISLMLDTFHLGRMAIWEGLVKTAGLKTFKAPFPTYRRGLTLLDSTPEEITKMISSGEIPKAWGKDLLENKRRIDLLVESGYNVGGVSDTMHQELMHNLPIAGPFNKWLFSQFQRGAMTEIGLLEFSRIRQALPELSEEIAARRVAKDLNTRFGNLGRQGIFKSRTGQDIARTLALAPQWNEGLIRSELGAIKQAAVDLPRDLITQRRLYTGVLMRSVGGMAVAQFAANQLINLYTRGHPTWDNPEEGWGAKLSAYIPDKGGGQGFFLHPLGLAAETVHLFMKGLERTGNFWQAANAYGRSRASIITRPLLTWISQRDYLERIIRPEHLGSEIAQSAIPLPIPARAVYQALRGKEDFPGQREKQLLTSIGIRTEPVPTGEQRIRRLASAFNTAHGIERQGEFYDSPYAPLTGSLGTASAAQQLQELLKTKTRDEIASYFEKRIDHPLTGKEDREMEFKKTLNPEQRAQYDAVKARKRKDLQEIRKLLSQKAGAAAN